MRIETILTPAELPALTGRDLSGTACVVFDILRATSTIVTALQNGANRIIPVGEIAEAVAWRQQQPEVLLAGERGGIKIRAAQSGGIDFDFGNSPREFRPDQVRGKTIVSTTTNGTRALRACAGAQVVLAAAFLNLAATAKYLNQASPAEVLLVCAGTGEGTALEDVLAAGALAGLAGGDYSDATEMAVRAFLSAKADLPAVMATTQNARRLLAIPELRPDVPYCAQRDIFKIVAAMGADGGIEMAGK
ncbi:MAG: 2-phosphosulfolactate phosphatase [Verrucomicrobiota bacterium]|jgi:2-phosphosulfolactate phosphatase